MNPTGTGGVEGFADREVGGGPDPYAAWLISELMKAAHAIPGVSFVERELAGVERVVLREFRRRLESVAEDHQPVAGTHPPGPNGSSPAPAEPQSLAETMARMLRRSMDQTPSQSRQSLFEQLVHELVPDEARILAALADGSSYPLLDVAVATPTGKVVRVVLRNASNIGRMAGVAVPSLVPTYVTHLLQRGLAETGQEDPTLHDEYEILLTEAEVMAARAEAAKAARRGPRIARATLQISALGRDFWAACQLEKGL